MSPQCNDKGKKNYLIEKIHSQRFDTHEISQILIKSTTNIFDFPTNTVYLCIFFDIRMTEEDKKLLNTFEGRLRQLLYLYEELEKENLSLKKEISQRNEELAQLEHSRKELETKYINLKNARILSINDNDLRDTKQRLAKLVREVDKCIALLNE